MTATSVLNRIDPDPTIRAWLRFAAAIVLIAAFTIGAFALGHATSTTTTRPANVPAQVSTATPNATTQTQTYLRRNGRAY